jgi:predicted glutamine amidotransferase
MCGICGVRRFGEEPITKWVMTTMLCANERRGNHATGIALQQADGSVNVLKKDVPAWNFTSGTDYNAFMEAYLKPDTLIALGHTRAATQGSPDDARNNHPLWNGHSAVVHNGMLSNDGELFKETGLMRVGEVDSDILRAILDEHGLTKKGIKNLKKVRGSCAIAAVSSDQPGKLILGRSGSPLVLASTKDLLLWSSEKSAIHAAMRPIEQRFGFPMQPNRVDLAWMTVPDDSIFLIGEEKEKLKDNVRFSTALEWHEEFNTTAYYTKPVYRPHNTYTTHTERFPKGKAGVAWCDKCQKWINIPDEFKEKPLWDLNCSTCKVALLPPPSSTKQ